MKTSTIKYYLFAQNGDIVSRQEEKDLNFPGLTVCSKYYHYRKIAEDLNIPKAIFSPEHPYARLYPSRIYKGLEEFGMNTTTFVWKAYFGIRDIIRSTGFIQCTVVFI